MSDSQRDVVGPALAGALRGAVTRRREMRYHLVRDLWSLTKRFGSEHIATIEIREIPGVRDAVVEGFIDDRNRTVLAALCQAAGAQTFFEIGTNRGRTAWTVARHNPELEVFTLDLPSPDADVLLDLNQSDRDFLGDQWASGEAFADTVESPRITTLYGDSASFDFAPYAGEMDVVFVDGAHTYSYVRNDTRHALAMLRPGGLVVWDDYPAIPGVYRHLNELAPSLPGDLLHIRETRLVVFGAQRLVQRLGAEELSRQGAA